MKMESQGRSLRKDLLLVRGIPSVIKANYQFYGTPTKHPTAKARALG